MIVIANAVIEIEGLLWRRAWVLLGRLSSLEADMQINRNLESKIVKK